MRIQGYICVVLIATALAACTAGQTTAPSINSVNPLDPNYSKLQLAVGTANLFGSGIPGLNIVSTLRQPNGTSAVGVNTPIITGPFAFSIGPVPGGTFGADTYMTLVNGGPSLQETTGSPVSIRGTPQSVVPGTPFCDGVGAVPAGFTSCLAGIAPN